MKNELSISCLFILLIAGSAVGEPLSTLPPESSCVCDFDTVDLCGWSAEYYEAGWLWSGNYPTTDIPSHGSDFLYITDISADVYYPYYLSGGYLKNVSRNTVFSFNFYLKTDENFENELEVYFEDNTGYVEPLASYYTSTVGWLTTGPLHCTYCCSNGIMCSGTIHVKTDVEANTKLQAAFDDLYVQDLSCSMPPPPPPVPPPNPKACICEFDTADLCGWSAANITDGWTWSGEFPTTDIPSDGSDFVYITNATAILYYPYPSSGFTLNNVSYNTTFTFNYYLAMDENNVNQLEIYFESNSGIVTLLAQYTTNRGGWRTTGPLYCSYCCDPEMVGPICSGTLNIQTTHVENSMLYAAFDNFNLFSANCNG